jgi:hypothetical protein
MPLELIENAGRVYTRSYSCWAIYAGYALLIVPELIFWFVGRDVIAPQFWWWAAMLALTFGLIGRGLRQRKVSN